MMEGDVAKHSFLMRHILLFLFLLSFTHPLFGQKSIHYLWTQELKKWVDENGDVNYKAWKQQPKYLKTYIKVLEENPPQKYWSKNDSLAYFINAYNAVTVDLILKHYPLKSIRKLGMPWRRKLFMLGEKKVSLGFLEHQVLRKMGDPRIHFAINCASVSCPKLENTAYQSANVQERLEDVTKNFLNDPVKNNLNSKNIYLSKIFFWFSNDFGNKKEKIEFINRYSSKQLSSSTKIKYLDYDWALNE